MRIDREGDRVWHRESRGDESGKPIYENSFEVSYVIGSGNHGIRICASATATSFKTPVSGIRP